MKAKTKRTRKGAKRKRVPSPGDVTAEYARHAAAAPKAQIYTLRLFVTGSSPHSTAAIATIRSICDTYLEGKFDLEVVDIYQQPAAAVGNQIIAAPTLIKQRPAPVRRMVGSLSDRERVLVGLDLTPPEERTHRELRP